MGWYWGMAESKSSMVSRRAALNILISVIQGGESLSTAMPHGNRNLAARDQAFVQMLVYGVLRHYWRLQALMAPLLKKKFKDKERDLELLIMLGIYQLMDTRVPDYASVDAVVGVTRKIGKSWASGLVNGVLRNFIRQQQDLESKIHNKPQAEYDHPQWMIDQLRKDWPQQWQDILTANNQHPPMTLRINQQKISPEDYQSKLDQHTQRQGSALILEQAVMVQVLPGYEEGWFSVQDAGAQLAAELMDLQSGQAVLDCCAAPGGKTCHMLELEPTLEMLALDVSDDRLDRVRENLRRLGLQADCRPGDALQPDGWWQGELYDRILLDVPCSASGVIRRHPDIKLLRRKNDLPALVKTQQQILRTVWPMLKPGAKLLYATCSIFKQENEQQVEQFMKQVDDAELLEMPDHFGLACSYGRQILPGQDNMDGFYYCLLGKKR